MSKYHQAPLAYIQTIVLNIHDRKKMVDFYTWLGMKVLQENDSQTILGTEKPLLVLNHDHSYSIETKPTQGLYHVAYLLPSRAELGSILNHLIKARYPLQGLSDHGVSEAIYLADPEGNGIEIYADRPAMLWPYQGKELAMVTDRMKYQEVLALAKPFQHFSSSTLLGHLHLHVANLKAASDYYQKKLGYQLMQYYGNSAGFLSTGGYHHHLGINTWNGQNIPTKNPLTTGIVGYHLYGEPRTPWIDLAGLSVTYHL